MTLARHEYGRVAVFRIKMRFLVQKLWPREKCQFSNCSHLFAGMSEISEKSDGADMTEILKFNVKILYIFALSEFSGIKYKIFAVYILYNILYPYIYINIQNQQ